MDEAGAAPHPRVAIVGAGFGGLAVLAGLKRAGFDDVVVLERGHDVGGTWRDNTYPGCQCDVPSHLYSFSWAPNPDWRRTYGTQPEIQRYLRRCADQHDLRRHVRFGCELIDARWDDDAQQWSLTTSHGGLTCDVLVAAQGGLSEPGTPELPGLDRFTGTTFHSGRWRHDHDLAGRRVAVIGTGASAIQIVPRIQPVVAHLAVFQRTPPWVLPHTDRPVGDRERALYRRVPAAQRLARAGVYAAREVLAVGMTKRPALVAPLRRAAEAHLRAQVVDPVLRAKLTPRYTPGCKRLLLSDTYYPALTRPGVELVTDPIAEVHEHGIATADGTTHEVDTIVFATGFLATEAPIARRIRGRGGRTLAASWGDTGARAYLGTTVPGFPNLFLVSGPNTGIGHTSLLYMIESQVPYIVGAVRLMDTHVVGEVDLRPEVLDAFDDELQRRMARTVWSTGGCASWYLDRDGRNTTLWPDLTFRFRRRTRRFDAASYRLVARRRRRAELEPASAAG